MSSKTNKRKTKNEDYKLSKKINISRDCSSDEEIFKFKNDDKLINGFNPHFDELNSDNDNNIIKKKSLIDDESKNGINVLSDEEEEKIKNKVKITKKKIANKEKIEKSNNEISEMKKYDEVFNFIKDKREFLNNKILFKNIENIINVYLDGNLEDSQSYLDSINYLISIYKIKINFLISLKENSKSASDINSILDIVRILIYRNETIIKERGYVLIKSNNELFINSKDLECHDFKYFEEFNNEEELELLYLKKILGDKLINNIVYTIYITWVIMLLHCKMIGFIENKDLYKKLLDKINFINLDQNIIVKNSVMFIKKEIKKKEKINKNEIDTVLSESIEKLNIKSDNHASTSKLEEDFEK